MEQFNGFEVHILLKGLKMVTDEMREDITSAEEKNRRNIMNEAFVDQFSEELINKIHKLTYNDKETISKEDGIFED